MKIFFSLIMMLAPIVRSMLHWCLNEQAYKYRQVKERRAMVATVTKVATLYWSSTPSPCGTCVVMATEAGVCWTGTPGTPKEDGFSWLSRKVAFEEVVAGEEIAPLQQAMDELRRYF